MMPSPVIVVGESGGTHLGGSFTRACTSLGIEHRFVSPAVGRVVGATIGRALWRYADRRVPRPRSFRRDLQQALAELDKPIVLVVGTSPIRADDLAACRAAGATTAIFLTDDHANTVNSGAWFRKLLPSYDLVLTPRKVAVAELEGLGCRRVRRMMFGIDPHLFFPLEHDVPKESDVAFFGTADRDRLPFVEALAESGLRLALAGAGWRRFARFRPFAKGPLGPEDMRRFIAAAYSSVCLVRRANRDEHVMRTFELAACGANMLVEDTSEHRALFGPDQRVVSYFVTPKDLVDRARAIAADPSECARRAVEVQRLVRTGHTYADRICEIFGHLD